MIEVGIGEYVRTYFGEIGKCIDKSFESCVIDFNKEEYEEFLEDEFEEEIFKHSFNIIDLIEEGDYVNGEKVFSIEKDPFIKGQTDIFFNRDEVNYWGDRSLSQITDKEIKSIVTKEQFNSMKYVVEGK